MYQAQEKIMQFILLIALWIFAIFLFLLIPLFNYFFPSEWIKCFNNWWYYYNSSTTECKKNS